MTLTDYKSRNKEPPEWVEEDQIVLAQGCIGEDIIVELKFVSPENYDDLQFELIRDGLPISSDRYRLSMRGNIVQLALKQSRKNDTGYYSLVATRLGQDNSKSAAKKIHLSVTEQSYEDGEPPVFLRRLSDLAVKVGTRTRFLVEVRSSSTLKITWYKDDSPINDGPRFSLVHEGNFHCVDVAPVTVEDQGSWTCMAENRSGRSSCTSTLTVIVPKAYKKPEFVEELRALLTETGTVSLECKVVGVPTPVLRWFKDSKEIKAGDVFALTANPDDPTSLGVYTCEAVNCMGTAYSSSKVHVVGRGSREGSLKPADALTPSGPLPVFKQFLQDECCRIGDNLSLSCRVQVPPWPKTITWYNKGGRVEPSEKYHIIEDGIGGYSIEVKQVEAVDEGEWKCVATSEENMKQFSSCYVAMSIPRNYRKPRFMENLKAVLTEEGLVSFECKVVGFPTPLLRWFKDGQELKPGDVYQLTGTNSLGSYCCIARNCMGEAKSTAELTIEDIQNQLNEEERFQLLSTNQPPKFIKGLRSCEARINEDFRFTVQVSVAPEPSLSWYRDDSLVDESDKYHQAKENLGTCHFEVRRLEFVDQAEWKCVAANDFGHSVTSCFLKLIIPKHYKKPIFLESLRAILSEEGAVNLECKVIGVPQPVLKWYKDNVELKPGDIHRIISGQDGTCCLGVYTCEATNCMGTVSSSASLLGFEEAKAAKQAKEIQSSNGHELARNLSLSTIHEERTSQLYDTPQTDHSVTLDERGEVSFSFDGKEVSVSLYETPDLTEEEALQIVEMYADQLSEHVTEHNVIELPPMRFVKETSTTGNLLMEAVVIDVSPDYFVSAEDDLRTEADVEDVSIMDDVTHVLSSTERDSRSSLKRSARYNGEEDEKAPSRPPRKKSMSVSSSKSERSQRIESESFHSAQKDDEPPLSPLSSSKQDDSDTFADALSSAHLSVTESLVQKKDILEEHTAADNRKRSLSAGRSTGSSLDDGIGGDSSFDSVTGVPKRKKQRRKKQHKDKSSSEEYSGHSDYDGKRKRSRSEDEVDARMTLDQPVNGTEPDVRYETEREKIFIKEELLDNLKSAKEAINIPGAEKIEETMKEDILLESRVAVREALKACENVAETSVQQFSSICERINDMYQILEITQGKDVETLSKLEKPLHALLKVLNKITSAEEIEVIRNVLESSILHLSDVVENLGLPSLQSTLTALNRVNERISNIPSETEKVSSVKSAADAFGNISEEIVDPLIDIQSAFSAIIDYMERSRLNGTSQQTSKTSAFAACLIELRECASHAAHTAMTFRENETLNSLMEFKEPLLDLQSILAERAFQELPMVKEITLAIKKLKCVVVNILKHSGNSEALSRAGTILTILEDTDKQVLQLMEQLLEAETTQKQVLKSLNLDQSLSNVHFALSSVLEKQEEHAVSSNLITCIETLRQAIGSSAVTIASLKNPIDEEITREISRLKESLLNLQRDLLTEKHKSGEEEILTNLMSPISRLKDIIHGVIERSSSVESMVSILQLLQEIERDATLVAKEISKKKSQKVSDTRPRAEDTEEKSSSNLAGQINRSLHPIKHWLSTSEDSTKDEVESELSSTVEELKRDVTQIAIQTSYSEPPSDESLIEALIDLREPLMRLKNAISIYHRPEDLSTLENLDRPMKHLLQTIMDVLREHANEEVSLLPIVDIVQQIENQLPLSIKDALYQQELKQSAKTSNVETEEEEDEAITASRETIPGTLTEIASTPLESTALPTEQTTEQVTTEDDSKKTADIAPHIIKNEMQEREENASKLITILSETLEKLQLEMTGILEDFEESTTRTTAIPQSKLANSLEELRRTISTIRMMTTIYGEEIGSSEEKVHQATLVLNNLTQPLMNIRELLSKSHKHDVLELMILNRLTPLLNAIENNVIRPTTQFVGKDGDAEKEFEFLLCVLEEIKTEIPNTVQEISSRRKILEHLRDISKPLESIMERMKDLEQAAEETLETDVAKILGNPIAIFLKDIKTAIQEADVLDRRESMILELRNLLEPLQEFHSCLSMVQSSRKSLVPEACLLEERRSVILRAVDGLQKQVCHTVEAIANMKEASLFNGSLMQLNTAILKVQKQIGKTDYSRRSSSVKVPLQHRLTGTLGRLANAILAMEEHADKDTREVVSKCLEALQKQISFTQMQFIEIGSESVDEEAIVEGFLYPTSQVLSALNVLKENMQKTPSAISQSVIVQLQELADSISELSSFLSVHKTELIQEGASNEAPIVETFSAVIDVLDEVKDSVVAIEKMVETEQKTSVVITEVESITDEIIEISQEEVETIMVITETPSAEAVVQEVAESKIEDAPQMTSVLENLEVAESKIEDARQTTQTSVLETLEIAESKIEDAPQTAQTSVLENLEVAESKIEDARQTTQTSVLETLEIAESKIEDAPQTAQTSVLENLEVAESKIEDARQTTQTSVLETLEIAESKIEDAPQTAQTSVLENLEVAESKIEDARQTTQTSVLETLEIAESKIEDAPQMTQTSVLENLEVAESKIEDVRQMTQTSVLETLEIAESKIEDAPQMIQTVLENLETAESKLEDAPQTTQTLVLETLEVAESKLEDAPQTTQTSVLQTSEIATCTEQEAELVDTAKHGETQEEEKRQKFLITQTSKFNSAINNLIQPLQEFSNFIKSATQESLVSKSDEDRRKIQELTALMQIIYDLQATNTSIKTYVKALLSSSTLLDSDFSRMENILVDLEQTITSVISLTDEGIKPELKENIMTSLQSFVKPLNALENILESVCQTIVENKYFDENRESLVATAKVLIPCISDTIKCLEMIQISKCVQIVDEKETEISKIKEEVKNIEETTARPLEELIEAIMDSQKQVKCDKTSESSSPSADLIKSKDINDLKSVEMETKENKVKEVGKVDDSVKEMDAFSLPKQDAVDTQQQAVTPSPTTGKIEELVEKKEEINLVEEYLEEVKEVNLEVTKKKIEIIESSEKDIMQKEQLKIETLQVILSPLQVLHKSLDEVGEVGILESSDEKTVAFSTLLEPLLNLELVSFEDTTEMKQSAVTPQNLSVVSVLEELQKSITTVQEQVQLYTTIEASPNETTKMRLMHAIEKPLEDLKVSLASIQSDPTICQQDAKLLDVEQITVLQILAKSVEEFGEKFMSIIDQVKVEEVPQLQIAKQEKQTLEPEVLQKIIDPIHILHETLSQIEDLHKAELLEIRQEKGEIVQLSAVLDLLKKLEQSLITDVQHVVVVQEEATKDFGERQVLSISADLKPVLEELKTSIVVVQQQAAHSENNSAIETLSKALEGLKMSITVVEEILDHSGEVTETEKVSTLLSFAKSVEETANQLVTIAKQDAAQQEDQVTSLLKAIIIPIEGLQSAILELEDQISQTVEAKEAVKVVALECMMQPLQKLQQSFLAASHQEIALSLQRLPIKPVLDNLNKSVAEIQEQVASVQDNLAANATSDDVTVLKDFARSLSNLRTSTVVLQQLNAIENASQQIVEIENASALQAFAKSVEEFRKCCSVVVERPKIVEAFAKVTDLKQSTTADTQLLENIIAPLRILQEQILTIEETKMQESEILNVEMKKPVTVLSSLIGPLQQLEKSFVATVHKEQVVEHDGHSLASDLSSANLEKLALQPILEEVQNSIATVQEHIVFEAGDHITSETETDALLKSIAQPLVDLKASIASIQQITAVAPDSLNELAQQNVSALETFAETLHNLSECIAMCNHQQIVMEPAADTISEGASSLNTWADIVEEPLSKVTRPMVIDQGAIESPAEIVMSISEDETSALKTLAKPLTELRECLAVIVDERKVVAPSDTTRSISEKEDISLLKTMIWPLLELNDAATAVIQEQTAIERAKEHSFEIEGNNEFFLRPLIEPLEELRHSIAVIQDQMLIETSTDRQRDNVVLDALAEPLFDLQRAISVLEARVMSPDVQSIPEDTSSSWITECLAIPLHEIERSIADIRQCTVMEPKSIMMEEQARAITPDWSFVEKLEKPIEGIKSVISRMEDNFIKTEVLKPMAESLIKVQDELSSLRNMYTVSTVNEEQCFDVIIEPLSNLEKCILFVKKEIDKPKSKSKIKEITTLSSALTVPLTELEYCVVTAKKSSSANLKNLERPLELVQNALETVLSAQRSKKFADLSTKVVDSISDINKSIESIEHKLDQQQVSILEIRIECEALGMLAKPLQDIKQYIPQIQEKPSTADLMIGALRNLEKSVAVIREQSADKPLAEPQHMHSAAISGLSKCLTPCLNELQESIEASKPLWREETALEGLIILDEPIYKLKTAINIISDQILEEKIIWIDTPKSKPQKKAKKKEKEESEIESVKQDDKTTKVETEDIEPVKDKNLPTTISEENKKKLDEKEKKEKEREKEQVMKKKQVEEMAKDKSEQKDVEKKSVELKKQEKVETITKTEEQKDINDKEPVKRHKEKNKIEELKKEDQKKETEPDKAEQKEQKHIKVEETDKAEILQKEKEPDGKTKDKEVKKQEEEQKKAEEIKKQEKEQKKVEEIKKQEKEQKKEEEKIKEVKEEKLKDEKIEELEKKQEESIKKEKQIKEETQKQIELQDKKEEQKKHEVEEKIKEEKPKSEKIEELKQAESIKKKEKIKQEKQKQQETKEEQISKVKTEEKEQKKEKAIEKEIEKITEDKKSEDKKIELQKESEISKQDQEKKAQKKTKEEELQQKEVEKIKEKEKEQKEKKEIEKLEEKDKTTSKKTPEVEKKKMKKDETKQKEKKIEEKIEETNKKVSDEKEKAEDLEKKKEFKTKEESTQEKITEKEQTDHEQVKKVRKERKEQKEEEALKKAKEEKDKLLKEEKLKELEKESSKTETLAEKIKEKKKDEVKISKKVIEEQNQISQTKEIKIAENKEAESKKDVQEKKKILKKSEREDTIVETIKEKPIKEKKEEIVKTKEPIQHIQSEKPKDDIDFQRQQEEKRPRFEERSKRKEEDRQWRSEDNENWLRAKENERATKSDRYKIQKSARAEYDNNRLYEMEIEKRRTVGRSKKEETDYVFDRDEERSQRRNEETRIRRDETARFLREEEQRLRRRHEEEMYRNKQRREEQIRESQWSRRRENETDRFLKNMLENRHKSDKSAALFFDDYHRDYISRLESGIPKLTSSSRSYSWRDSLTSLNRKLDDYWEYKLRGLSTDKYHYDTGSSYRRRRKRENRMIRARSISLIKYEDYSTEDSDATIVPSTHARSTRRTKVEAVPRVNFDAYEFSPSSYIGLGKSESLLWDKPKKPSFCTKLTNRTVEVGMRIRLTCTVLGNPEPRVYWTKDGYRLDASDGRCRIQYENGMAYLELHDALSEDAGLYTCIAENAQGTSSTESTLRVYSDYKPAHSPPTFAKSIKDTYRHSDRTLILECRVRAHPTPSVTWLKDGQILQGERYRQSYLDDDVYRLEISDPSITDNGQYTCRAMNELHTEETSHMVHVEDWRSLSRSDLNLSDAAGSDVVRRPRFSNLLKDYSVPAGGTIALQVEVKGVPPPEVKWLRGDRKELIAIPKARTFTERGLHTLIVPEATESERGTYVCRAINAYGQVDTTATVDVISGSAIDGGKPAVFVSRPAKKSIDVIVGEDVSVSFRVNGVPKPRVIWMKGLTDITDGPRSYKETIDDYVRLTLKRALPSDEGTYCILVKNRYGCDRSFFSIKVKQRARSLTPSPDWDSVTGRDAGEEQDDDMSYVRNVPGPISSEPVAVDGGKNWLSLTWGKAERRGPAPVIAYKVDAWQLGSDGGARWMELGVTPINAFDAFNLRPGGEYKFRVTPRNRYGWGEPVTMTNSVTVSESTDLPEFTKILPGQLKALEGTPVKLECEVRGDSNTEVRWYRETTEIDARNDSRYAIDYTGLRCSLTIASIKEDDSGRYVCEASNKIGKVSSFARVLVVTDPRIIEADAKLRTTNLSTEPEDRPPQFTMRIRDRRVQTTYPVRLTCQVTGQPVPEITWYKNGTEISQDDRHIFWDDDSNFHTLEIIHSTLDDSGCYMVTARNINGSVSCRCNLVVDKGIRAYIAPEFLRGLDAVYTIHSNEELRLSAQLEAYPSVGVVWHRDGIRLRPSRRAVMTLSHDGTVQFSLASATARDAGVYSCTATNVVGHAETSARVTVIATQDRSPIDGSSRVTSASPDIPYSKEPLFVTKPLSTEAVEGDTVTILCEVVGDPKPEVIWLRDFLKPDYYRDAPHFRLVGAGPQYRLEIPYAKLDFTGTYSVIARNCHGEAKAVISLQIYAKGQGKEERTQKSPHGRVLTLPIVKRELRDLRCCDGDAVSLECKVHAAPEPPLVRWERAGKIIAMVGDFASEFDGETARLSIQHVYPEDEGEYTCVAYNDLGKAYTSACLVVDVPEGKENILSQRLTRPVGLLSAGSTPRSTPRSTPIRSLSPAVPHGREFRSPQVLPRSGTSKRPKVCPPKFYAVPHNRLVQEGETVRFQCAVVGHPAPWVRWDKNGMIVTPSARISVKERDDVKILEIVDVMREDAALYRVTAENDFGRIEASARLEVISRYESTSRTIRTRSASPRTYPSFDRSLLPTTSRINGRLNLECRVKGSPSVTPTWYRNGRPLERSDRIKRHFDGTTIKIEILKVKASDAGEYTCVATNVLGSTRSSCQVSVLDPYDSSTADKNAPRFVQSLPEETIVMENHCHEFQTGITGTPPFAVTWSKDGRELPDNNYYKHIIYGDGGVALRLFEVRPQDAGEYTCVVRNDFGAASCTSLFAVQDYKEVTQIAPQFTKTPLSITAAKGSTACFCARVQCGKTMEITWTINGKDARDNTKCKIERDGNVSILRIRDVSSRDTGEVRCTASVNGKGASISYVAKLRLQRSPHDLGVAKLEDAHAPANANPISVSEKTLPERSPLRCRRRCEQSPTRARSSSFPRRTAPCTKDYVSPSPVRKRTSKNASIDVQKSQAFKNDLPAQRNTRTNLDRKKMEASKDRQSFLLDERDATDVSTRLSSENVEPLHDQATTGVTADKDNRESTLEKAAIIEEPADVTVFRGNKAVFQITYQGRPEPTVRWLRVNRELRSDERTEIVSGNGVSRLTLDHVTYDHAGKYEVSVENSLGKERRYFSLAVEGPPEPPADKPSAIRSADRAAIVWRSPPYDGGRTVTGYTVEARRAGESTWTIIAESCHSLSYTTTETNFIIPGESYRFRVRAENIHGLGEPGTESDPVRIPKQGETMFQEEKEDDFEPSFEARVVEPEEGKLFDERYEVLEELGKGRYGVVKRVTELATGMSFAAKFVRTIKAKDREQVREEIKIMNILRHPKLLLLAAAYESPRETVLVTEYISGGELFERVVADDFTLTEWDSILFMRQICEGVEYMHRNKIVHLDLKPENIMCRTRTSHQIKLIDFGLAQTLKPDTPVRVLFGTPEFIPPEIISYEPIGTESDMWSVGVICYVLLTGLSPFMGDNDAETFANITRADYDLDDEAFDAISDNAKDFISNLLIKRKELRMSAAQCLEHPWMAEHNATVRRIALPTEKLKKFIIRRKWQKTGNAIRALGRMAILSAYSRRSPTSTAESSPTLEQRFDIRDPDEKIKSVDTNIDIEDTEQESAEENLAEVDAHLNFHPTCVTEVNMMIKNTPEEEEEEEESVANDFSKQIDIEKETSESDTELASKMEDDGRQDVITHLEILMSKETKKSDKKLDNTLETEQHARSRPQALRRVFRGDSRDSGIGDCSSGQVTFSLQVDEQGIVSITEEETDHETHTRENKRTPMREENRRSLTAGILTSSTRQGKDTSSHNAESATNDGKVATKSDVTKASCETNSVRKVTDESTDARTLSGRNARDRYLPTGNVSRTARMFERESGTSRSDGSQIPAAQSTAIVTGKSHHERIQKAFAFWNK